MTISVSSLVNPNRIVPRVVSFSSKLSQMQKDTILKLNGNKMNVTKLSQKLHVNIASLSRCLRELIQLGLIMKKRRGTNHFLELTPVGKELLVGLEKNPEKEALVYVM